MITLYWIIWGIAVAVSLLALIMQIINDVKAEKAWGQYSRQVGTAHHAWAINARNLWDTYSTKAKHWRRLFYAGIFVGVGITFIRIIVTA